MGRIGGGCVYQGTGALGEMRRPETIGARGGKTALGGMRTWRMGGTRWGGESAGGNKWGDQGIGVVLTGETKCGGLDERFAWWRRIYVAALAELPEILPCLGTGG